MDYTLADFDLFGVDHSVVDLGAAALPPYDTLQYWPKVEDTSRNDET